MIAAYLIIVSVAYGLLWRFSPHVADAVIGLVVLLLLVPAGVLEVRWWKRGGGPRANS